MESTLSKNYLRISILQRRFVVEDAYAIEVNAERILMSV